jgi:hypothetical protein
MVCSRIIHKNESAAAPAVNPNPYDRADFGISADSSTATTGSNFAPESSLAMTKEQHLAPAVLSLRVELWLRQSRCPFPVFFA